MEAIATAAATATVVNMLNFVVRHVFKFGEKNIRAQTDEKGETWFHVKDICDAIDVVDDKDALSRLDKEDRTLCSTQSAGGIQMATYVNESGLYSLVLSSRKPAAKPFKRWVTHEVLPSIHKYGAYVSDSTIADIQKNPQKITELLNNLKNEAKVRKELELKHAELEKISNEAKQKIEELERQLDFDQREAEIVDKLVKIYMNEHVMNSFTEEVAYVFHIEGKKYKYGKTLDLKRRASELRTRYGAGIKLIAVFESIVPKTKIECLFRSYLLTNKLLVEMKMSDTSRCRAQGDRELFTTRPGFDISFVISNFLAISNNAAASMRLKDEMKKIMAREAMLRSIVEKALGREILEDAFNRLGTSREEDEKYDDSVSSADESVNEVADTPNNNEEPMPEESKQEVAQPLPPQMIEATVAKARLQSLEEQKKRMHTCVICKQEKMGDKFANAKGGYLSRTCKACSRAKQKAHIAALAAAQAADPNYRRQCNTCKENLPATSYVTAAIKTCRTCQSKETRARALLDPLSKTSIMLKQEELFKVGKHYCNLCRQDLPLANFSKNKVYHYGVVNDCKACISNKYKQKVEAKKKAVPSSASAPVEEHPISEQDEQDEQDE